MNLTRNVTIFFFYRVLSLGTAIFKPGGPLIKHYGRVHDKSKFMEYAL